MRAQTKNKSVNKITIQNMIGVSCKLYSQIWEQRRKCWVMTSDVVPLPTPFQHLHKTFGWRPLWSSRMQYHWYADEIQLYIIWLHNTKQSKIWIRRNRPKLNSSKIEFLFVNQGSLMALAWSLGGNASSEIATLWLGITGKKWRKQ